MAYLVRHKNVHGSPTELQNEAPAVSAMIIKPRPDGASAIIAYLHVCVTHGAADVAHPVVAGVDSAFAGPNFL